MQNASSLSTNKIVVLLVFLCAAIMTSLFIYRISHQDEEKRLPPEQGSLFAAPRDIKPFELVSIPEPGQVFSEKNLAGHWTLLFFGFTHCTSICPATLGLLDHAYKQLHAAHPNLQVVFVSLDPERDSLTVLNNYTQRFNANFIAASGKIQNLRKLQSQLGVMSVKDEAGKDQLQHTASILVINPQGKWSGLLSNNMKANEFVKAVGISLKQAV